jgi:hypothetical protein
MGDEGSRFIHHGGSAMSARDVIAKWSASNADRAQDIPDYDTADAILSALRSAGWAVVPVEPTEGMYLATCDAWEYHGSGFDQFKREYQALLKAAQEDSRE